MDWWEEWLGTVVGPDMVATATIGLGIIIGLLLLAIALRKP